MPQVFDRAGGLISLGDKVAWASKHGSSAQLKLGIVEQIDVVVVPSYSYGGKQYEILKLKLKARVTKYGWRASMKPTSYLARTENSVHREVGTATEANDVRFWNLEKIG